MTANPFKLSNQQFKEYTEQANYAYQQKMIAAGFQYWPAIDRWYPIGTTIKGLQPLLVERGLTCDRP